MSVRCVWEAGDHVMTADAVVWTFAPLVSIRAYRIPTRRIGRVRRMTSRHVARRIGELLGPSREPGRRMQSPLRSVGAIHELPDAPIEATPVPGWAGGEVA